MATALDKKYADLKSKLDAISKNAPILKGRGGMIELDPNNPHHKEWYEESAGGKGE